MSEFARVMGPASAVEIDLNDITKHVLNVFWDLKPGEEPVRPEAVALMDQRRKSGQASPSESCMPSGIPTSMLVFNVKMIQTRDEIVLIPGDGDPVRQIYVDGRTLPKDPIPSWMGTSAGRWQGDTLIVETNGLNDSAWLDGQGHPRSEAMRMTERFRRRDLGHMDYEVSLDDPTYYTRPFGFKTTMNLLPDSDVLEYVCTEGERDTSRKAR